MRGIPAAAGGRADPAILAHDETLAQHVRSLVSERAEIVPYDPASIDAFAVEKAHPLSYPPGDLVHRIEYFGSTAVPGLAAKPNIDILVGVTKDARRHRGPSQACGVSSGE